MHLSPKIASHYAIVWFQQAAESDCIEETYHDIILLRKLIKEYPSITQILHNPSIPSSKKQDFFIKVLGSHVHLLSRKVLLALITKKREPYLDLILKHFLEKYNIHHHIQVAWVTTTFKLPSHLAKRIEDIVKKLKACKSVILKERIDPSLLGGFILKVGDQELDNSLVRKLAVLKNNFMG